MPLGKAAEVSRDKCATSNPTPSSKPSAGSSSNSNNKTAASNSVQLAKSNSTSTSTSSPNKPKNSNADKLGKNGKLTAEECDRHFKLQLCLRCGLPGHQVPECKLTKDSVKGKASTTEPAAAAPAP